jgi:hypothetical protein
VWCMATAVSEWRNQKNMLIVCTVLVGHMVEQYAYARSGKMSRRHTAVERFSRSTTRRTMQGRGWIGGGRGRRAWRNRRQARGERTLAARVRQRRPGGEHTSDAGRSGRTRAMRRSRSRRRRRSVSADGGTRRVGEATHGAGAEQEAEVGDDASGAGRRQNGAMGGRAGRAREPGRSSARAGASGKGDEERGDELGRAGVSSVRFGKRTEGERGGGT